MQIVESCAFHYPKSDTTAEKRGLQGHWKTIRKTKIVSIFWQRTQNCIKAKLSRQCTAGSAKHTTV